MFTTKSDKHFDKQTYKNNKTLFENLKITLVENWKMLIIIIILTILIIIILTIVILIIIIIIVIITLKAIISSRSSCSNEYF